jgi:hypothetical protein
MAACCAWEAFLLVLVLLLLAMLLLHWPASPLLFLLLPKPSLL